ncbi:hypothetical protein FHQ26_07315 [Testudinibacter sp. TR-2022]|uniref:hypothetical protein n=1 Tax=Testudinibacter sp. TR-2022 TaxID=2585029 RepID=UPI001119EBB5|nr:hypothetical protein [Testudinibacter sp. TR-2022]TNH02586.1 hypothetical protein FHQ22_09830 [Pasteurellaceae bacterium Phil31]TNH08394.1 hypothetical protein FHQ25_09730 [Testudinibacter sp. TR-2022]TNH09137.1 hypothetical protein FHQ26_07315 [Testudinibacter sp. TR-2022]TNH12875.1 hypothetical protein FIA56_09115 [Testudinibacter sp. TR-2022]TNH18083.1 hypothetical protein FHQ23_06125 [Testudinibacter sp. TR-2022]
MWRYSLLLVVLLAGCVTRPSVTTPTTPDNSKVFRSASEVVLDGKTFVPSKTVDLIEMVKYVYEPKAGTKGTLSREKVILFFDKNLRNISLQQRMELRQRSYQHSENSIAELSIQDNVLYSTVIYRPSAQYDYWGVEVAKGRELSGCGFLELQYAYAQNKSKVTNDEKVFLNNQIYPNARQYLHKLQQQPWLWQCE